MRYERVKAINILGHSNTEVRFSGLDSAVVAGANGSGKSTMIIDVPMIACFGKGRSGDLDGYIRNGADWGQVEFDFSNDQGIFSAARKRSKKTSKGTTVLTFDQIDSYGKVIRPLTAGSIGDTEEVIRKTLGLDYDTLVRSSIIEQGEADLFCEATPSDRMELMAKVWDLEKYDDWAEMARGVWKDASDKAKVIEDRNNTAAIWIEETSKKKPELMKLRELLVKQSATVDSLGKKKSDVQTKIGVFNGLQRELDSARSYLAEAGKSYTTIGEQHKTVLLKIERFVKILKNQDVVKEKVVEERKTKGLWAECDQEVGKLDRDLDALRGEIVKIRGDYQTQIDAVMALSIKLDTEITVLRVGERSSLDLLRKEYAGRIEHIEERKDKVDREIKACVLQEVALNRELSDVGRKEERLKHLRESAGMLEGQQCHPDNDPTYLNEACKLLRTAVDAKRSVPGLEKEVVSDKASIEDKLADVKMRMSDLEDEKGSCVAEVEQTKNDLEAAVTAKTKEVGDLVAGLEGKRSGFLGDIERLRKNDEETVAAVQSTVEDVMLKKAKKKTEIEQLKVSLEDIGRYTKLLPEIDMADVELPKLKKEERDLSDRCAEMVKGVDRHKKEIEKLELSLGDKPYVEKELQSVCKQFDEAVATKDDLAKNVGFIDGEMSKIEPLKEQIKRDESEAEILYSRKALYDLLEQAFKQIPYMLVARSVGAVESLANEILVMISPRGLRVKIETEKQTKTTKKIRDEIHLSLSDEDGPKQYKFLSGGEKVRVALALRLAISEVFASRRGVRIDSLIADEPFEGLDAAGIEAMKDAMRELKKRFKFMAVVTHIDQAQDIFPTRLMFEYGAKGSTVNLEMAG